MPRFHQIVLAYEGECSQCGGCCGTCDRLSTRGRKRVCKDHNGDKPSHCVLFPIGYAVELIPETCTLVPTRLVPVDETVHTYRVQVSGRTSVALFDATREPQKQGCSGTTLYDFQGRLEATWQNDIYAKTPAQHLERVAQLVARLQTLETQEGTGPDVPLTWRGAAQSETILRELIIAANLYATRRDIIVGDLFDE